MHEKSVEKYIKKLKPRRGRPPGSKNKNKKILNSKKIDAEKDRNINKKTGLKVKIRKLEKKSDKPTTYRSKQAKPLIVSEEQKVGQVEPRNESKASIENEELDNHILIKAAKWLSQHMHHTEVQYYKSDSRKKGMPFVNCMVSDILGFFNVRDTDLHKYIKTNKFIVNYTNTYGLHK